MQAYDAANAEPPVISAQPQSAVYNVGELSPDHGGSPPSTFVPSKAVSIDINASAQVPSIGTQPAASSTIFPPGGTVTLSVVALITDGGTLTYQWYSNTSASNSGGLQISGATSTSYTTPTSLGIGTYYYYCVVTNTNNSVVGTKVVSEASSAATVKVTAPVNWTAVTSPVNAYNIWAITYGDNKFVAVGGDGEVAYCVWP